MHGGASGLDLVSAGGMPAWASRTPELAAGRRARALEKWLRSLTRVVTPRSALAVDF